MECDPVARIEKEVMTLLSVLKLAWSTIWKETRWMFAFQHFPAYIFMVIMGQIEEQNA